MPMRSSSLANNPLAITRELDGRYDVVLQVRDNLDLIEQVAGVDFAAILAELESAQDFTGITVVQGETVAWDAVNKILTVPKGDKGDKGDTGLTGPQGTQGIQGPQGIKGDTGLKGDTGSQGPKGFDGAAGAQGLKGDTGDDLTITQITYNGNGTFNWLFSDGTTYVTPDLKGPKGDTGDQGIKGDQGISVHHLKGTSTTNPNGDFGTSPFRDTYTFYGDADETLNLGWFVVTNGFSDGMSASVYDANANGIVDNSERLGGELPSHYVNVVDNQAELALKADATTVATKINNSEKGVANGVATLDVNGKVVLTQIPDSILGQLEYVGTWNFTTMPTATQKGQYWIANVSGNGYVVGDWAVWNGVAFDKVDNTDAVASVAGRTGNVVLTKTDVGLNNVDNTADSAKNVLSATKLTTARAINGVNFDGSTAITVTANTAQSEIIKFDTGTTEGTDLYTFNGSSAKTINIKAGTNVTLTKSTGSITINANDTSVAIGEVSGLGTGVSTFLSAPTSANLAGMLTDETGTGANVFANSPTLVTPALGVATGTSFNSITGLSSTLPVVNGVATIGTSTTVAKADHIHPSDTTKVTKVTSTDNAIVRFDGVTGAVQGSGVIIDDNGNVGIGTNTPDFPLEVVGNNTTVKISNNNTAPATTALQIGGYAGNTNEVYGATLRSIHDFAFTSASSLAFELSGQERVRIDSSGNLLLTSGTGALGYGTGAGGTVTQLTSKDTPVTLNKPCGTIITSNSTLAPGSIVSFIVHNNLVTTADLIYVYGGAYAASYQIVVDNTTDENGKFNIRITNTAGLNLSNSILINFLIIKGARA